jgi:hypothetical protein
VKTVFFGVSKNRYLIVHLPEKAKAKTFSAKNEVTGRYVNGPLICGFNTTVAGSITSPFPLLFLDYPECFEILNMRTDDRVTCFTPATLLWDDNALEGRMLDIGKGGCKIVTDPTTSSEFPSINVDVDIACRLVNDDKQKGVKVRARIRRIIAEENKLIVSAEFPALPEQIEAVIGEFVDRNHGVRLAGRLSQEHFFGYLLLEFCPKQNDIHLRAVLMPYGRYYYVLSQLLIWSIVQKSDITLDVMRYAV